MTVTGAPMWAVVPAAALLLVVALLGAVLDGVLATPRAAAGACTREPAASRGWLLPFVETARLLRQRNRETVAPDRLLGRVGSGGLLVAALLMAVVIPVGGRTPADLSVGIVWFNAMDVVLWAAVWLAGWGPNSVHPMVGGYRFLAQALSYELPLMFALTAPAVGAGSLRVADVVAAQEGLWFAVWMPVAFVVFLFSVAGFSLWGPFGYPLGPDAAGGVLAEASGADRLLLLAGRYALLAAGSGMAVALFLGGGAGPWLPGWLWSLVKTLAVLGVLVAVRRRVPVVRADRLAPVAWLVVLPAVLLQVLAVSIVAVMKG
ncbi:complex I subunit 1 family protein [Streptomyces sp. NPDC096094]|uniref:complex I subunit 1 family protein n=1 Tax=Streptomyces sp. NPDC096094 TaxID=3366073 RepID=UPI00380CCB79